MFCFYRVNDSADSKFRNLGCVCDLHNRVIKGDWRFYGYLIRKRFDNVVNTIRTVSKEIWLVFGLKKKRYSKTKVLLTGNTFHQLPKKQSLI